MTDLTPDAALTEESLAEEDSWLDRGPDSADAENIDLIDEYDLTSSPNDFNVMTIVDFVRSGAVRIPGFQRNFVWDIRRASKLIESLLLGLPVPQVFLYEEKRDSFQVIDGQQRLMTLFYFAEERFPRKDKRVELRRIFDECGEIPRAILNDDAYFQDFSLRLSRPSGEPKNRFNRLTFSTLGDYQTSFKLRTIRNIIVKQVKRSEDDSSIYEMFNRLNTGGVLLTPQEIRASLNHSDFFDMISRLNLHPAWRRLVGRDEPELHMRDVEVLLRAIALWRKGDDYAPSMVRFLNSFAKQSRSMDSSEVRSLERNVEVFLRATSDLDRSLFLRQGRFSLPLFEAVFVAAMEWIESEESWTLQAHHVARLAADSEFVRFAQERTTDTTHVKGRLGAAREILAS